MTPRVLTKAQAIEYCGCATASAFDDWVRRGIIPHAICGTTRWDRRAIDAALDLASGLITPSDHLTPYQRWKADEANKSSEVFT